MLSSAVRLLAATFAVHAGATIHVDEQTGRLTARELDLWRQMEPSIATLVEHDHPVGAAALIDDSGLFVAARVAVRTKTLSARLSTGQWTKMTVLNRDSVTGLVLLQAQGWTGGEAKPFRKPLEQERPGGRLLAVLGTGPIRAEFVTGNLYGVFSKYRRLVSLSEFRFEAPPQQVGAALIFCENGELIGTLNATLHRRDTGMNFASRGFPSVALPEIVDPSEARAIGPSQLTVAYTVGPEIVGQVLDGFRSPTHRVVFPSLGVYCTDEPGGGARIREIEKDSAAARARFRVGDVIHDVSGEPTPNQVEFAKVMNRQQVGAKLLIRITRGPFVQLKEITVGQAKKFDED